MPIKLSIVKLVSDMMEHIEDPIYDVRTNLAHSTASTPQKMLDDNSNFAASLQLLSTPFQNISSMHPKNSSFKEHCQSVEVGKKKEDTTIAVRSPQLSDDENEWESLAVLSDDAAVQTTLKNGSSKTTPSKGESTKDEVGGVVSRRRSDLGLEEDSAPIDDVADSGTTL